ncbi:MAG: single-stranded-DNA-specific exonuclease RecJ [Clostridia bacterium]|nr:single-stranded-DNA-specific exonuclease RecJ [Clostridia bacterium]
MSVKKWVVGTPDREKAKVLAEECDIDPFAALIAVGRGIDNEGELELLMSDEPVLCDPLELADIKIAADYINNAITQNVKIAVFGDYDCDGVVATSLLYDYLVGRGASVVAYIPDRIDEGYGMNCSAIDKLAAEGVGLIITVDNGISCEREINYANSLGIKTVVTDHHLPPEKLPDAVAVVDPHRVDCPSAFKEICGAEVAFKLVCALDDKEPEQMLSRYADILAVATIGDVMPLVNENRSIVKAGIRKIKSAPNLGLVAILNMAGIERSDIDAGKISFGIVPRINAAGRMGSAYRAFQLLTADNAIDALKLAGPIDDDNVRRQQIEKDIFKNAVKMIEEQSLGYNRVIVVCGENWHFGVLGIVASRICERYGKPAIILSKDGDTAHGSGRSFSGFHLYNAINACNDVLLKYGGHELAAGVSVSIENVDIFRQKINEYALTQAAASPCINIDFRINPAGMSVDMAFAIKSLEPFGMGNPTPIFGIFGVTLEKITAIGGGKHLKLLCRKNGNAFQALLFGVTQQQFCFCVGDVIDLAVTLDTNLYQGQYNLSVQIKAIKMSEMDQNAYFEDKCCYDDFISGAETDFASIFPDRAEVGSIYKMITASPVNAERLKYIDTKIGYAKTQIAVNTLSELGLISLNNGVLVGHTPNQKNDLLNSATYKKLYERVNGCE